MKKIFLYLFALPLVVVLLSWGTWGHQHINHAAVFALPDEMRHFFYNHIDYITEESTIPDARRSLINDKGEPNRHYIDMEEYGTVQAQFDTLPATLKDLTATRDQKYLDHAGILPWYIEEMEQKLTVAFKRKSKGDILFLAADLAHYIGDAHQPLHTTTNYDGQMTDQRGIHSFFESQLPELFGSKYNFHTGDARFVDDVHKETWRFVLESHRLLDTVLLTEKKVHAGFDPDKIWAKDAAGNPVRNKYNVQVHTPEYAKAYHDALNGLIERQLRAAVSETANFWYTAWVNAGKPDLNLLDEPELTARNAKNYKKDYKRWKKGELFGFKVDKEF